MKTNRHFARSIAKRTAAFIMSLTMVVGLVPSAMADAVDVQAAQIPTLASLSKQVAEEGTVLLKNDNQVLPLAGKTVSVFGRTQNNTQWTGYGSGGYVKSSYKTNVIDFLRQDPSIELNEELAKRYADWTKANPGYEENDWRNAAHYNPEMPLEETWVEDAAKQSEVAVVIIGRRWGEGRDLRMGTEDGSYYLTSEEKKMLSLVNKHFENIAVVFNTGSVMDMEWVANNTYENIDAYVYGWQGGTEAGRSIAEVLTGEVNPSGKLPVTIMEKIEYDETNAAYDTKYSANGAEHVDKDKVYQNRDVIYQEDIYLGYRYTETFGDEHVLYPFGYGLSYTEFETITNKVEFISSADGDITKDVIKVDVTVTNVGDVAGKEVVQVYYGAPQGELGKASKTLAAYAKTNLLQPNESQNITLKFTVDKMASYDEAGKTDEKYRSAYVLEAGEYPIYVGNSVKAEAQGDSYVVEKLTLVEQLQEAQAPTVAFDRVVAKEENGKLVPTLETVPTATVDNEERILSNLPDAIELTGNKGIKLLDVYNGTNTMDEFIAQLSEAEVARLTRGVGGMGDSSGIAGNASAWGGATDALKKYGIPVASTCDGPSGIRHSSGDGYSTVIPSGITLGSTWNDELVEKLCMALGEECLAMTGAGNRGVDVLLAPGMNIIRNPRCGRNYEYFSEDPLLTGRLAASYVKGLQKVGVVADVKHYVAYNQGQGDVNSMVSERALREIYLKGFEIAIKESNPYTVMDSNGLINGEAAYVSYDLNTTFLRTEWGWDGMVMTDWGPKSRTHNGSRNEIKGDAYSVQSQCDISMPGHTNPNSVETALKSENGLSLGEVQRSAKNVLNCLMKTPKFALDNGLNFYEYEEPKYERFTVETTQAEDPRLSAIYLNGDEISNFDPLLLDYTLFTPDLTNVAKVTYDAPKGVTVAATTKGNVTTIKCTAKGAENIYKVVFTDAAGLQPMVKDPKYARLSSLKVNEEEVVGFYPTLYDYEVYVDGDPDEVDITYEAAEDVDVSWNYDTDTNTIVVRSVSAHQAVEYHLKCVDTPIDTSKIPDPVVISEVNDNHSNRFYLADHAYYMYNLKTEDSKNEEAGHKNLSNIATDSYALYQLDIEREGYYNIDTRFASNTSTDSFDQFNYGIEVDGVPAAQWSKLAGTGGWQNWTTLTVNRIYLPEGVHRIKLFFITDGLNLSWMEFDRILDGTIAKEDFATLDSKMPTLNKDLYTAESWSKLETAYEAAKKASTDESMDGTTFLGLVNALDAAMNALVIKPATPPTPPTPPSQNPKDEDTKVQVSKIKITGTSKEIAAGKKITLKANVTPANATDKSVTWESSNTKYATVSTNGKVSIKSAGKNKKVTITATANDGSGKSAKYQIKIMPKAVKKITVKSSGKTIKNNTTVKVKAGKKLKLKATVSPAKNVNKKLAWSSSNTKYATVKNGNVTTKKAGKNKTVKITAKALDGSGKKLTIKVKITK